MLCKYRVGPLSKRAKNFDLRVLERQLLSKEHKWSEFHISFLFGLVCGLRGKYGPGAVKEDIGGELFISFELRHTCSVDSDDVSDPLGNRKVIELVGKQDQSAIFYGSILPLIYVATLISNFKREHIFLRLKALVWELCIQNDSVKMHLGASNFAFF